MVAQALAAAREAAASGSACAHWTRRRARSWTRRAPRSPFLDYHPDFAPVPFPAAACASVNDAIVHGIPDDYRLRDGDLVSVDFGAVLDGWAGDSAISFTVGRARPEDMRLVETAFRALDAGIAAAVVGNRIGDIAHAIGRSAARPATASRTGSAATASAAECTRTRACPTRAGPGAAWCCGTGWCSRSSRW